MDINNNPGNGTFRGKKIFLAICIYFLLTLSSRYAHHDSHSTAAIAEKISKFPFSLQPSDLYQIF